MKSMTGFGQGIARSDLYEVRCECVSVNRKHLDIQIRIPSDLAAIESALRMSVGNTCVRGSVVVSVKITALSALSPLIDHAYLKERMLRFELLAKELNVSVDHQVLFKKLLDDAAIFQKSPEQELSEQVAPLVFEALNEALTALNGAKISEGKVLEYDFLQRAHTLQELIAQVEIESKNHFEKCRQRLTQVLTRLGAEMVIEDQKLAHEIAMIVEKADISEELVRALFHTNRIEELAKSDSTSGKQIEFVLQELLREWNTIGSKVQDIQMTTKVIDAKCQIERLREQVANVE